MGKKSPKMWPNPFFVNININQGCQMVYFPTENLNLGKFWSVLH
jgi:hypothetical protein